MNYNPYYFTPYIAQIPTRVSGFNNLFGNLKNIKWSSVLGGTQKVLNIANQTIPLVKQVTPVIRNAKTMFKVMNEFKKVETPETIIEDNNVNVSNVNNTLNQNNEPISNNGPIFFI